MFWLLLCQIIYEMVISTSGKIFFCENDMKFSHLIFFQGYGVFQVKKLNELDAKHTSAFCLVSIACCVKDPMCLT